ncbi:MAG: GAF domain-containing protein [Deltaproteobacteria bacterium]|nr:GAF domain-containing protein [Deltaproteobacteria bacterium]
MKSVRLTEVLRRQRHEILAEWEAAFRRDPVARDLDRPALVDSIPQYLDRIVELAENATRVTDIPQKLAEFHGVGRLDRGFNLGQVVMELALLRDIIFRHCWQPHDDPDHLLQLQILNHAIDKALSASVSEYTEARERNLKELDRVVRAAVERPELDDSLRSLARLLLETSTRDVDLAAIMLRDGEMLRERVSVGLETNHDFAVRIGEGFAGLVAADQRPRALTSASTDPLVLNPALRAADVRALYGAPLIDGGETIGVAFMGSRRVSEFTRQDQRLLDFLAERATWAIHQHMARETLERTSQLLREREVQLQTLADNIPQLAWMADEAGSVFWYNRRWFEFTGATFEELAGLGWQRLHHPDHLPCFLGKVRQAIATGQVLEDTFPMRGRDGRYRWFLTRAVPIRDGQGNVIQWFGTSTDVSGQRFLSEATKLLGASLNDHETLERLAHLAVPDVADWCVVDVIEASGPRRIAVAHQDPAMIEYAREWARRFPPDWSEPRGIARVLRTGEPEFVEAVSDDLLVELAHSPDQLTALRELGLVSMLAVPLVARNRTLGVIALVMAESSRHYQTADVELAMELGRRAGVALDNTRHYRESQDAVRLREQILAIVSHDLRSPLTAIELGTTMALESPAIEPTTRKQLEIVQRSTLRMERIIGDLLDLAHIQSGKLKLDRTNQDAAQLLTDVLEMYGPIARDKAIKLIQHVELRGALVHCDRGRIEQVLGNIMGNAIKFCRPGDTITVRATREDAHVRYIVEDTGPGIPEHDLPHVFEAYWSARDRSKHGLGLGLYISKSIIDAHGGEMWVQSKAGDGATLVVTLPVAEPQTIRE